MKSFRISGRITDSIRQNGISGLRVEAWDKDLIFNDLVGSAITDEAGGFQMEFDESYFRELLFDRYPDLFFKVFRDGQLIRSTEDSVLWNVRSQQTEVTIEVDVPGASQNGNRRVSGHVRLADGSPVPGINVRVVDRDLRSEEELGQTKTDRLGFYQIKYSNAQSGEDEIGGPDLVLKALATDDSVLAASAILFNAAPVAELDLTVPAAVLQPPSLFEKIKQTLEPVLGRWKPEQLEQDEQHQDLTFLTGETGFEKQTLARFVLAHKLTAEGLPPEFWFVLLGGSFYEFTENQALQEQLTTVLANLSTLDANAVRKAFTRGFNNREIPDSLRENVEAWLEEFLTVVAGRSVNQTGEPTLVKSALADANIDDAPKQAAFARLFNQYGAFTPELLDALEKDEAFTESEIADLHTSFQLSDLTRADFSVVKVLKEEFRVRQPEQIRKLARTSQDEWVKLVQTKHAAGEIKLPIELTAITDEEQSPAAEIYGRTLERQFREAFPTAAFAGGLDRALQNGGSRGLTHAEALSKVLEAHENFELMNTPVDDFFKNNLHADFHALAKDESFVLEVKAVQRVFKLAPSFAATDELLADDLHSAQKIYRLGQDEFVRRYANRPGFTETSARVAWHRAADTYAATLTIVADLKALEAEGLPLALQNNNADLSKFPNWNNLFKAGDLCDCEHCRSVFSPAAYFADLLMFLKDRQVKDILFQRRPDLGYLELNCENALTPLPYVDMVCEVLEDVIADGANDLELVGFTAVPTPAAAGKAAVAAALAAQNVSSGADFTLSQVNASDPNRWVVHGEDVTYLLKKKAPSANFFAEILRNTKASAAELRAYPQYANPKAYEKLRMAKYPLSLPLDLLPEGDPRRLDQGARSFSLPFDLFDEEVRASFRKCNLQRWDLMNALRRPAPNSPTDAEIAAEYFGISVDTSALRLNGPMTAAQRATLLTDPSLAAVTSIPAYQQAVQELFQHSGRVPVTGLPAGFTFPTTITGTPNNIAISYEPFTFDERQLLLQADATVAGQQEVWGEPGNPTWFGKVGNVKTFLQKTGLEYVELLALLDLKFINPAGDIVVHHLDPSCDTEQKIIQVLDATKLDRIHRFLRMWRKLDGWKMWELDLVIRHPRIGATVDPNGALDDMFLVNLFYLALLRNRLGAKTSVEQVCALFGDLNTTTSFTKPFEKRAEALYQSLFLNRRLIRPLDPAFQIDNTTGDLPVGQTISDHTAVVLAALGIREGDLSLLKALTKVSDGTPYINYNLTLANLSFIWRHAWLAKRLKFKTLEWKILLNLLQHDFPLFADPQAAWKVVETVDRIRAAGFTLDELSWLLTADRSAKAATKESDAARFLGSLRKDLQAIHAEYAAAQYSFLTATPPTDVDSLTALLTSLLQELNRDEAETQLFIGALRDDVSLELEVAGLPAGFDFPAPIKSSIRIRYDEPAKTLHFTGMMTAAEQSTLLTDPSLSAVTAVAAYQDAIQQFFAGPRLALKFFESAFTVSLPNLPPAVDFGNLTDPVVRSKISYDSEQRLLRYAGILSRDGKAALDALSADAGYRAAVINIAAQPALATRPDDRIWMLDTDLAFPLRDLNIPANDNLARNLATAIKIALPFLARTASENAAIQQSSAQLAVSEALTRQLFTGINLLPGTLLSHLTGAFVATSGVVDYTTLKTTFDGWFWANRVAAILRKWKITAADLEAITALTAPAQLLDFQTLPIDDAGTIASIERFLRTNRLLRLRDGLPENDITLFEVLEKLNSGAYAAEAAASTPPTTAQRLFAEDVERLNDAWLASDVEALTASLDLVFPADYLLAETWERLRRAFYFIDNLNGSAERVEAFAAATMTDDHAKTLKELLRSKFGTESWLTLSADIQDALRERKRDALAAYRLTHTPPTAAPTGKWDNTNDLYAYYLLDVEMCSCQLTSRLVQGSGSVQLFVQRCFMGLEPAVTVNADGPTGDSAWRWWKWMRKYRVWEANRKVFLWPENWVDPRLKKDRSPFFKDLESELLQNEVNQYSVETAYANYLQKLHDVAQLEVAGFYQEDDGDNTIIHVFGRTVGAEPHIYYYRSYDYRQWTAWEKVELDIQGDYLIPAVVNKRLFLFWPVFTEVPDETANDTVKVPKLPGSTETSFTPDKTKKRLKLQMAVSQYRQGKWTPKKVSKDFALSEQPHVTEISKSYYYFFPIDRSEINGRFGIRYGGYSDLDQHNLAVAYLFSGTFEIAGCDGVPVRVNDLPGNFVHAIRPEWDSTGNVTTLLKWQELGQLEPRHDQPANDFTLENSFAIQTRGPQLTPLLNQTPWIFKMTPPWQLSYLDKLWLDGLTLTGQRFDRGRSAVGTWLPFFYSDKKRAFFVLPLLQKVNQGIYYAKPPSTFSVDRYYYPEVKKAFRQLDNFFNELVRAWVDSMNFTALSPAQRQSLDQMLRSAFPDEAPPPLPVLPPPYTPEEILQVKTFLNRLFMRVVHLYLGASSLSLFQYRQFHFKNFYHPFVCDFARLVNNPAQGIPALMSREIQLKDTGFGFQQHYQPNDAAVIKLPPEYPSFKDCHPREVVDFTPNGSYSIYNWELFFHAPLLIANLLSTNQRFEEARDWYHFIFNPIGVESPIAGGSLLSRYWITKPFFETTDPQYVQQRIDNILRLLAGDTTVPGYSAQARKDLEDQVLDWRTNPFEPHRIANYRTVAYQKTVIMNYLDNLIAWGDNLFRQDSMESINEATQLYILAAEILGPPPKKIPAQAKPPLESFNELEMEFDKFSNALVQVENLVPQLPGVESFEPDPAPLPLLYFCIPQNDKLLGYWDTVADRLYKIRHCMNIEGVVRQLALFEPPIDPGALVKAVAAGVDISSALADLNAPLPLYRFNVLLQKANEVCNDVKALGNALLTALEKKDAEALALLRQSQEMQLQEAVKALREKQIQEATENLNGIKQNKELVEIRRNYYASREFMNAGETVAIVLSSVSVGLHTAGTVMDILGGVLAAVPDFNVGASGFGGSPVATVKTGGSSFSKAIELAARSLYQTSTILDKSASISNTVAGYERRRDEWGFQRDLAVKELMQIGRQIAAAELRLSIAEKELENHLLQIENAKATDAFMRSKYTNLELYQWQVAQVSSLYFQSYRLAYDLAKRAERCFRFELGSPGSSFINFGYWDSLKKGLLSGEKLQLDLRRLETAYLEQNRREFELTKHASLALLDPLALVKLRETGRCFFSLPEELFDLDFPGHYFRRIKSVSLTLPCVAGPYNTISCTLRLLKNSIRINTGNGDNGYPRNVDDDGVPADDGRFIENNIPVKAIAASSAQNDSGLFELNFRDERYLPFEGAGTISLWSLELLNDSDADFGKPLRQFDYGTISDAILHIKYTSREDAGPFKHGAVAYLRNYLSADGTTPSVRMFNLRQEFPGQWQRFINPTSGGNVFEFEMNTGLFALRDQHQTLQINTIWILARCTESGNYTVTMTPPLPEPPPPGANTLTLAAVKEYGGLHFTQKDVAALGIEIAPTNPPVTWQMKMTRPGGGDLHNSEVEDALLVLGYDWK